MSRTTDHFIHLNEAAEEISCLHDALKLEIEFDKSQGVTLNYHGLWKPWISRIFSRNPLV